MHLLLAVIDWANVTSIIALLDIAIVAATLFWVLTVKREPISAIAWSLLVILVPVFGVLMFFFFGYQNVHRPLSRKRRHAEAIRKKAAAQTASLNHGYEGLAKLAVRLGAAQMTKGNRIQFYFEGAPAFDAMIEAIQNAKHHIHVQFFITRGDESGERFMNALAERVKAGVQVRFLYDAVGSWSMRTKTLRILTDAGGKAEPFLTLMNPLRRRLQINLRNHRKILVIDGKIGFTGGLNIGDEYLGKSRFFGPWRDTHLRLEGPAVRGLQRSFAEDWDFATDEELVEEVYFPVIEEIGDMNVQIASSGPDQDIKTIREVFFAAIMRAHSRVWIATPYFVPDSGLLDGLGLAARSGRDVRILCPFRPDKWFPLLAGRFYWGDMLRAGVKVYQYTGGFLHEKLLIIDDEWASVGSANFDNRSLLLNFELNCLIESRDAVRELEASYLRDLEQSILLTTESFYNRPFVAKVTENVCRLLSPVL